MSVINQEHRLVVKESFSRENKLRYCCNNLKKTLNLKYKIYKKHKELQGNMYNFLCKQKFSSNLYNIQYLLDKIKL